jgi:hypothetical protein
VASFRYINFTSIHLGAGGKNSMETCDIADELSKHFQSVYNDPCPVVFLTLSSSTGLLSLAPVSVSDISKATLKLY